MMCRKGICRQVALFVGICLSLGLSGHRTVQRRPFPFDPSLSLIIAVEGNFSKFPNQQWQRLVLYPTVTVYLPDEPYQELESELPPKDWALRHVQTFSADQLPEGWHFFFPDYGQPLRLHVAIYDDQNRLSKVVVKAWDGTVLGELLASPDGGEVVGSLDYAPEHDLWVLEIWQGGGANSVIANAVGRTPKAETAWVWSTDVGFVPEPDDPIDISNPLLAMQGVAFRTYEHIKSCPDNDTNEVRFERPSGIWNGLQVKSYLTEITDLQNLPADKEAVDEIKKLREAFVNSFTVPVNKANWALLDAMIPPFSRNATASWRNITVYGHTRGIVVIPVFAKERKEWVFQIGFKLTGTTRGRLSVLWAAQINAKFTQEKKKELQIGDALPLTDLYALTISRVGATVQAEAILQAVTISIQPDKSCAQPVAGGVQIEKQGVSPDVGVYRRCLTHSVNYAKTDRCDVNDGKSHQEVDQILPPPSFPSNPTNISLNNWTVLVELPKGFRYKFKPGLWPTNPPCTYEIIPEERTGDIPFTTQVPFFARLKNVAVLKVYVYPSEQPIGVGIEVYRRLPDGSWSLYRSGPAYYDKSTNTYLATFGNLLLDRQSDGSYMGIYQVKARINLPPNQSGSPRVIERSETYSFEPACEVSVSL